MKLRLALVAVLLSAGSLAAAGVPQTPVPQAAAVDKSKVDGKWTLDIATDQGAMSASLDLKSDGKKVTGTIVSPQGEAPLEGEYADGKLAFGISIDTPEGAMQVGFAGTMQDDGTLSGTLSGPFGEAPWTATRVK